MKILEGIGIVLAMIVALFLLLTWLARRDQ